MHNPLLKLASVLGVAGICILVILQVQRGLTNVGQEQASADAVAAGQGAPAVPELGPSAEPAPGPETLPEFAQTEPEFGQTEIVPAGQSEPAPFPEQGFAEPAPSETDSGHVEFGAFPQAKIEAPPANSSVDEFENNNVGLNEPPSDNASGRGIDFRDLDAPGPASAGASSAESADEPNPFGPRTDGFGTQTAADSSGNSSTTQPEPGFDPFEKSNDAMPADSPEVDLVDHAEPDQTAADEFGPIEPDREDMPAKHSAGPELFPSEPEKAAPSQDPSSESVPDSPRELPPFGQLPEIQSAASSSDRPSAPSGRRTGEVILDSVTDGADPPQAETPSPAVEKPRVRQFEFLPEVEPDAPPDTGRQDELMPEITDAPDAGPAEADVNPQPSFPADPPAGEVEIVVPQRARHDDDFERQNLSPALPEPQPLEAPDRPLRPLEPAPPRPLQPLPEILDDAQPLLPTPETEPVTPPPVGRHGEEPATVTVERPDAQNGVAGQTLVYHLVVTNAGTTTAHDVVVEDHVPQGVRLTGTIPQAFLSGDRVFWKLGSMNPGERRKISIRVVPRRACTIASTATVRFSKAPSMTVPAAAAAPTAPTAAATSPTAPAAPQLQLFISVPAQSTVGQSVLLRFSVVNRGPADATGVRLRHVMSDGLTHAEGRDLEYEIGTVSAGRSEEVTLVLAASQAGSHRNQTVLTAEGDVTVERTTQVNVVGARLVVQRIGAVQRRAGQPTLFRNRVINQSPEHVSGASVVEVLPAGLEFVEASDGGQYNPRTRTIAWPITDLPPGQSKDLTMTLVPKAPGTQTSVIRVIDPAGRQIEQAVHTEIFANLPRQ